MNTIYLQCRFKRNKQYYTAWIPEEKVKLNKFYKLKMDGIWQDGWKLVFKSAIKINESQLSFIKDNEFYSLHHGA